jgi:hypothetical protein
MLQATARRRDNRQRRTGHRAIGVFVPRHEIPRGRDQIKVANKTTPRRDDHLTVSPEREAAHFGQILFRGPRLHQFDGSFLAFAADNHVHLRRGAKNFVIHEMRMRAPQHRPHTGNFFLRHPANINSVQHRGGNRRHHHDRRLFTPERRAHLFVRMKLSHRVIKRHAETGALQRAADVEQAQRQP